MTTLITGANGYLASNLYRYISDTKIIYEGDVREYKKYSNIDNILHFASPSDTYGFRDKERTTTTILSGSMNMIRLAQSTGAKLIFASTMGVYNVDIDDAYSSCKLAIEHMIQCMCDRYIILRIPRVYSPCRKKGLMRQIREGTVRDSDKCRYIDFITIQEFIEQTLPILDHTNVIHEYDVTRHMSIHEIERWISQ